MAGAKHPLSSKLGVPQVHKEPQLLGRPGRVPGFGFRRPSSAHRASAARVGQLQEALNERHSIINALKAK